MKYVDSKEFDPSRVYNRTTDKNHCVMVWCVFNRVCPFYKSERSLKGGANLYYNFQVSDVIPYYNFLFTMCYGTA